MASRQWEPVVAHLSSVQKLVHLAMRQDQYDADRIRGELLRQRRAFYDAELTAQAQRVGCNRQGRLGNGIILSALNEMSVRDGASIVNTYNYDLAAAILNVAAEVSTANRYTYAKRLGEWDQKRAAWKNPQIAQYTEMSARAKAQQDFYENNAIFGYATLEPKTAVCPVCIGWIKRGKVPLDEATRHPPPYHVNCPHWWRTVPDKAEDCRDLWMGA